MSTKTTILILGIGNSLLKDEGAGIHVIEHLKKIQTNIPNLTLLDGGTLSFTLAPSIEAAEQLIVIDAAELGDQPGTINTFEGQDMDRFLGSTKRNVHEVGLMDLMDIARLTHTLPTKRALIAIQPAELDWGEQLSTQVAAVVPKAATKAIQIVEMWQESNRDHV